LIAVGGLVLVSHLDPTTFGAGVQTISAALLALALIALVLGGFQQYAEAHTRTFEFTPFGHECWAHITTQRDGRITTQMVCDLHVFNLTNETRWLTDMQLIHPRTRARVLNHMIMVRQQAGQYFGGYEIPPRGKTDARGSMIIDADLSEGIAKRGITVRISDQDKHWHRLRFPGVTPTRAVVPPAEAPPPNTEEGVAIEPPR
jgi:hypothetical protein